MFLYDVCRYFPFGVFSVFSTHFIFYFVIELQFKEQTGIFQARSVLPTFLVLDTQEQQKNREKLQQNIYLTITTVCDANFSHLPELNTQ